MSIGFCLLSIPEETTAPCYHFTGFRDGSLLQLPAPGLRMLPPEPGNHFRNGH